MAKKATLFRKLVESRMSVLGLKQVDLALRLKLAQPNVSSALDGNPRLDTFIEYAQALECTPWELLKEDSPAHAPASPDVASLAAMLAQRENELKELRAQLQKSGENLQKDSPGNPVVKNKPVVIDGGSDNRRFFRELAENASDADLKALRVSVDKFLKLRRDKAKTDSSSSG